MWKNVAILVLVMVVGYLLYTIRADKQKHMNGVWYASPEFCAEGGVGAIVMTIADGDVTVKVSDDDKITETKFTISTWESPMTWLSATTSNHSISIGSNELNFPAKLSCEIDVTSGIMRWFDDEMDYVDVRRLTV